MIALALAVGSASAQEPGRPITFLVRDRATLQPVRAAALVVDRTIDVGQSDSLGMVRTTRLGVGSHSIVVRRLGYRDIEAAFEIANTTDTLRIGMDATPTPLPAVAVEAQETPSYLRDFERRRAAATDGLFLTPTQLDSLKNQSLSAILRSRARGGRIIADVTAGGAEYLVSTRPRMDGAVRIERGKQRSARDDMCLAQVVVDQALVYTQGPDTAGAPPFDLRSIPVSQIAAIEYYANDAVTPAEFKHGPAVCGTLVITSRYK
jgi:hypothetical protein